MEEQEFSPFDGGHDEGGAFDEVFYTETEAGQGGGFAPAFEGSPWGDDSGAAFTPDELTFQTEVMPINEWGAPELSGAGAFDGQEQDWLPEPLQAFDPSGPAGGLLPPSEWAEGGALEPWQSEGGPQGNDNTEMPFYNPDEATQPTDSWDTPEPFGSEFGGFNPHEALYSSPDAASETADPVTASNPFASTPTAESTAAGPAGAARGPAFTEARDAKGNITLTGTGGDDTFNVSSHRDADGNIDGVTVRDGRGKGHDYLGADAGRLSIDGGDGDDRIRVDASVRDALNLRGGAGDDQIRGGSGNDNIDGGDGRDDISGGAGVDRIRGGGGDDYLRGGEGNDRIEGGEGNDLISGGAGRDYIDGGQGDDNLYGNSGNDTIYGGQGRDLVAGGAGDDYAEGGKGDDTVSGGEGNDFVSGGRGNDRVLGGVGDDVMNGGEGRDRLVGSSGNDTAYADSSDRVDNGAGTNRTVAVEFDSTLGSNVGFDPNIDVDGNPDTADSRVASTAEQDAFRDRVEDDLDLMRSSVAGQQLLRDIDTTGQNVTFRQIDVDNGYADWAGRGTGINPELNASGTASPGQGVTVGYNPNINVSLGGKEETPFEVFYHEMSHGLNITSGTLQPGTYTGADEPLGTTNNSERQAVGLPNQGVPFDHDNNPATPAQNDNPTYATERGISAELGRQQRPNYTGPLTP